jgi:hypothetical protein
VAWQDLRAAFGGLCDSGCLWEMRWGAEEEVRTARSHDHIVPALRLIPMLSPTYAHGSEGGREGAREGARERGSEGARERGGEGGREGASGRASAEAGDSRRFSRRHRRRSRRRRRWVSRVGCATAGGYVVVELSPGTPPALPVAARPPGGEGRT